MHSFSASVPVLPQLLHQDIAVSQNFSTKIFPTWMLPRHYSTLLSWQFQVLSLLIQHGEQLKLHHQTLFRAKQILDSFILAAPPLDTDKYQLASAVCLKIAFKMIEGKEYPGQQLLHNTGGLYSADQLVSMEEQILAQTAGKLESLHSPYAYCSDEFVMQLLPLKLAEAFQLMVAFVSTHPNSFGVNSLSIFLALVKRLTCSSGASLAAVQSISSILSESVVQDSKKIEEVLQELEELEGAGEQEPTAS